MDMSSMTQKSVKSGNSKYNGAGLTWTSKENASKDPLEDIGETLYVICVTSMGLFMFMAMAMMSEKTEEEKKEKGYKPS